MLQSQPAAKVRINRKSATAYKKMAVAYLGALESTGAVGLSAMVKYFRKTHQLRQIG